MKFTSFCPYPGVTAIELALPTMLDAILLINRAAARQL
jgi:hypothetical protein